MARRVFFSFHYERDNWRASIVRNSRITQEVAGYIDAADWEKVKAKGDAAIKSWINDQLDETSVTVVLIGPETSSRPYVKYEIDQSVAKGNGLLCIYVHQIKDKDGKTDAKGSNPLPAGYPTYDWIDNDGYNNVANWIEAAAKKAGR